MINKLVIENLKDHWVRTLLSAILVGFQVMLILTLIGVSRGLLKESADRAKGTGADIFLKPDTGSTFSFSSGQVPQKFVPYVAQQPHVAQAVGVLTQPVELIWAMNGVDIPQFEKISGGFHYVAGGEPKGPNDLLVDESYARQNHLRVGATVNLLNWNWHLAGIVQGGMLGRFVVPLTTLQTLTSNPGRISQILVKLDNPDSTDEEVKRLNELLKGNLRAISIADLLSQFNINALPLLPQFISVLKVLNIVTALMVVFLSMYTAVVERTREIGILKALGAKPFKILDILIREALVLALLGWVIGIALTFLAKLLLSGILPASFPVANAPDWWPIALVIAVVGALLGAIYPGLKAARQDAIEALAYE